MKPVKIVCSLVIAIILPALLAGCCKETPSDNRVSGRVYAHVVIDAPPEQVWDYAWGRGVLMDQEAGKLTFEWYPWLELRDFHGRGLGGTSTYMIRIGDAEYTGTCVAVEDVPGQKHVAKLFGDVESTYTLLCVPFGEGTKLIAIDELSIVEKPGAGMSGEELIKLLDRHNAESLQMVKEKVEGK